MDKVIQLGPLALPVSWLVLFVAWQAGSFSAERLARRKGHTLGVHGWLLPLTGWIAARAGFVWTYREGYAASPAELWRIVDIRDGGWQAFTGLAAAGIYGAVLAWRRHAAARPLLLGLALFCTLWFSAHALSRATAGPPPSLPNFSGVALDARTHPLPSLIGQSVVINLWASWCPPCRREMPVLLEAQRANPQIRFLWVNQGEPPEVVQRFAAAQGLPADAVILDTRSQLGQMIERSSLPTTLFYDTQGQLIDLRTGEVSAGSLRQYLQRISPP